MGMDARLATGGTVRRPNASRQVFQYVEEPEGACPIYAKHKLGPQQDMPKYVTAVETL
jgi:hypothetical protein